MINRPLYVDKIMAYTDTPFVKVLTGVRRCGKSTVLKMIMEKLQQEHGVLGTLRMFAHINDKVHLTKVKT